MVRPMPRTGRPLSRHPGAESQVQGALPDALEQRSDLTPEMVKYFVRNGVTIMPFFRKTEISDAELNAIADYLTKQGTKQ